MGGRSGDVGRETLVRRPTTQRPSPLSTFNGPQVGLGAVSLNTTPMRRVGGGAGPAGVGGTCREGRGLSCTCRSARSCWTAAPPWACGPRSTRWAAAPAPAARSTAPPTRPGCAGCTGPGPAGRVGGVRVGGHGEGTPTPPASPHLPLSYLIPFLSVSLPLPSFHSWLVSHCLSPSIFLILYPPAFFSLIVSLRFSFSFHLPTSSQAQVMHLHGSPHISVSLCLVSLTAQTLPLVSLPSLCHLPANLPVSSLSISPIHLILPLFLPLLPRFLLPSSHPQPGLQTHLAVLRVQAPDVGAGPQAEIGVVALGFVNPLPAQVLAEVNVELPNAAVLFRGAAGRREGGTRVRRAEGCPSSPGCACVSPWLPASTVSILVSLATPVMITAITVIVMIITNTDKALPLVQHCAKGILINMISGNAQACKKPNERPEGATPTTAHPHTGT